MPTATTQDLPNLLTPEQTATLLDVSVNTLSVWRCVGRYPGLKYVKVGHNVRYRRADVLRWLESRTVGGVAPDTI